MEELFRNNLVVLLEVEVYIEFVFFYGLCFLLEYKFFEENKFVFCSLVFVIFLEYSLKCSI